MPSSGLQSIRIGLPSTRVLGFTHIVPQGGTSGFCGSLFQGPGTVIFQSGDSVTAARTSIRILSAWPIDFETQGPSVLTAAPSVPAVSPT
jgi:hypothetical protein